MGGRVNRAVSWVMLGIFAGLAVALTLVALTVVLG